MSKVLSMVIGIALMLVVGQLAIADGRSHVFTSTFTIAAALEIEATASATTLRLEANSGQPTIAEFPLRVGTNDWPLDLHMGLLGAEGVDPAISIRYAFVEAGEEGGLWLSLPSFSDSSPVTVLSSPAWTDYMLALRATAPEGTETGVYNATVRVLLRSRSGKVASVDFPVELVVD